MAETKFTFFDGGYGTIYQELGLKPGELPETWNINHSEIITKIHQDYVNHGAQIIKTNTFGANCLKFSVDSNSDEYSLANVIAAAVKNAKAVEGDYRVALDVGPIGRLLAPLGDLDFEDAVAIHKRTIEEGIKHGVDLILIETLTDIYEAKAAVLAAKETAPELPVFVTLAFESNGKLLTGADTKTCVAVLEGLGVDALGINCSQGPDLMIDIVKELVAYASVPVIVNPNAGLPRVENGKTVFDVSPEDFARDMKQIASDGALYLGGCCGTTPMHIKVMKDQVLTVSPKRVEEKEISMISSYHHTVEFGKAPVLIGERINPTGKKLFKEALRQHNIDYILNEGMKQEEKGAHVLDVNVGLPEIDEVAMMIEVVSKLQEITNLPLQIDTTDATAMEQALRRYNGKAMVNSVNGKEEVMEQIFPLVKKYGGLVVALTIDEDGIPESAEGRIAIAKKIYERAESYGIKKKDIIIDPLAMSISADPGSARVTLDSVRGITKELGGITSLGVSNVSFGLPNRELMNSSFFAMALNQGLSAAIMNPNSDAMMNAYYSFCALNGYDNNFENYISKTKAPAAIATSASTASAPSEKDKADKKSQESEDPLISAIVKGLKNRAAKITKEELEHSEPLDVINNKIIPALDIVGQGYEKNTVFLPQLLMSAESAKHAFNVISEKMAKEGGQAEKKGRVILATVQGDIHDIGKNIVKVIMDNYGYEIIDLGKDVDPELVVDTIKKEEIKLVGLSALMTTTVPSMERTIKRIHEEKLDCKVMVGGAVLTQEYADMIKADRYVKDALASVRYAEEVFA